MGFQAVASRTVEQVKCSSEDPQLWLGWTNLMATEDTSSAPIRADRLSAQQVTRHAFRKPSDIVAWFGAIQAQDYAAVKWAVGLRLAQHNVTDTAVEAALNDGSIIRTHAMRWTFQLVSPADIRWIVALVGPRLFARSKARHSEIGLDNATFLRANEVINRTLADRSFLTREELAVALERADISVAGPRLSHILARAEFDALICSGPRRDNKLTYTLLDRRVPKARSPILREEALAHLATRYFQSRGPATLADFRWFSGLTAADARIALGSIQSQLESEQIEGERFWRVQGAKIADYSSTAFLLPAFDEYLIAYRNREEILDKKYIKRVNAGGGMLKPTVVVEGRLVGTWRRTIGPRAVTIKIDAFLPIRPRDRRLVANATRQYGLFLGREARILK